MSDQASHTTEPSYRQQSDFSHTAILFHCNDKTSLQGESRSLNYRLIMPNIGVFQTDVKQM